MLSALLCPSTHTPLWPLAASSFRVTCLSPAPAAGPQALGSGQPPASWGAVGSAFCCPLWTGSLAGPAALPLVAATAFGPSPVGTHSPRTWPYPGTQVGSTSLSRSRHCPGVLSLPCSSDQSLLPSWLVLMPTQPWPPEPLVMRSPPVPSPACAVPRRPTAPACSSCTVTRGSCLPQAHSAAPAPPGVPRPISLQGSHSCPCVLTLRVRTHPWWGQWRGLPCSPGLRAPSLLWPQTHVLLGSVRCVCSPAPWDSGTSPPTCERPAHKSPNTKKRIETWWQDLLPEVPFSSGRFCLRGPGGVQMRRVASCG